MRRIAEVSVRHRVARMGLGLGLALAGSLVVAPSIAFGATALTVSTTADTPTAAGACGDEAVVAVPTPLSLREATCLANNIGGEVTISVPAGIYALSFGELIPGIETGQQVTYAGAGSATTIIDAQGLSRVFNLDSSLVGGIAVSMSGLTITRGAASEYGGAGIIGGSNLSGIADSLTLDGVVITGNIANAEAPDVTHQPGGGIQFFGGTLTIANSTISNNSSHSSAGAGVAYLSNDVAAPEGLTITDTLFSGNTTANTHDNPVLANGGALWIDGPANSTVTGSRFQNNTVTATTGPAIGAAIWSERTNLTVTESTFTGNAVSGGAGTPTGGAIGVTSGSAVLKYNRFTGNSAASGSALGVQNAAVTAGDNWWGCNGGPGAPGCDSVAGSATVQPRLVLSAIAGPATVTGPNATSTITGRVNTNLPGGVTAAADLDAFATLPVTFSDPAESATVGGSIGAKTASILAGQAHMAYQSNTTIGISQVDVTLDNAVATASVTVQQAPGFTSTAAAEFTVGTAGTFTIGTTGYPAPVITTASALPGGITLVDNGDGTATLGGTPTSAGVYPFTITGANEVDPAATQNFTATVAAAPTSATLTTSAPGVRFGSEVSLTAGVAGAGASGSVTFTHVPATGPNAGSPVTLGSVPLVNGVATLPFTPTSFGLHTITAAYSGDATWAAATSSPVTVEVNAYRGQLTITEFRTSGPNGTLDGYVELYNTGAPIPLAGFRITSGSGAGTTLPADAGTLPTGRSYLVAGPQSSLGTYSHPDLIASIGSGGFEVIAPDTAATRTDAAGPATGPHLGTGLSAMDGSPTDDHAWVRTHLAGAPRDTANNSGDFTLISTAGGTVGGVPAAFGSPAPTGSTDVHQHNTSLSSTLLDPLAGAAAAPNRVKTGTTLTVRRTITNTSDAALTDLQVRLTSLSQTNGAPYPGPTPPAKSADLRLVAPATTTSSVAVTNGLRTVTNLSPDTPTGPAGGGLNSTLTVPLPEAGLAAGASIDVSLSFTVVSGGTFWLGYDVESR